MDIRFVPAEEIVRNKWNGCVHYATNGNVFGYQWYLNNVAKEWDALVEGDYQSVFPLIWKEDFLKRKGLYQPPLLREAGLYSVNALSPKRVKNFLQAIPKEYKSIEVHLNERIALPDNLDFKEEQLLNYQLAINEQIETLEAAFTEELKASLHKAKTAQLQAVSNLKPEVLADFYKKYSHHKDKSDFNFHALQRLMYNAMHRGVGFISGVVDKQQQLCAINFFIYSHNKILSLVPLASPYGWEHAALPFMFNVLLQTNAGRPLIIDFNVDQSQDWVKGFGAKANSYSRITKGVKKWKLF